MFEYERTEDRLTLRRPGTRWLSNGVESGIVTADAAHNLTVPEGFDRTDLTAYATERLGETPAGPTLFTGVSQSHARGARAGPIEAVVTAGVSNPAILPIGEPPTSTTSHDRTERSGPGTVNVFVGADRALSDGGLIELSATAVEAKTATLLERVGCTGTTSDAIAVGGTSDGDPATFAGSATELGNATRICVRDAIVAALDARYEGSPPAPEEAAHGTVTAGSATVFSP